MHRPCLIPLGIVFASCYLGAAGLFAGEMSIDAAAGSNQTRSTLSADFDFEPVESRSATSDPLETWAERVDIDARPETEARPVPEPGSLPLMALVLLVAGMFGMRRWFDSQAYPHSAAFVSAAARVSSVLSRR